MTREQRDQLADDLGYVRYHCRTHGTFWSDTGPYCERCAETEPVPDPEPDEEEEL